MASASGDECGYADLDLEAGVAAQLLELGSDAGYSDCSEVLRPADAMEVASGDGSLAEAGAPTTPKDAVAVAAIDDENTLPPARLQHFLKLRHRSLAAIRRQSRHSPRSS